MTGLSMTSLADYIEFEERVTSLITGALSDGESIITNKCIDKRVSFKPDIYLPEGCSKLQLAPKTIIDCVYRITFDSVSRIQSRYLSWLDDKHLLIVFADFSDPGFLVDERVVLKQIKDLEALVQNELKLERRLIDWKEQRKRRIEHARNDIEQGYVTLFLGAGVSIDAELPSWDDLLKRMEIALNNSGAAISLDSVSKDAKKSSLIEARALRLFCGSEYDFKNLVRNSLYKKPSQPSNLVDSLVHAIEETDSKIQSVITYNFDDVLERNLSRPHCSITDENRIDPGTFPIFHVHGFIPESSGSHPSSIVFSEESYHDVYKQAYHWSNIEQLHALANTSCFFIGLSMIDPNLRRLLDIASERDKDVYHYAFLRRPEFKDPETVDRMLLELHVRVIWYMQYAQLPKMVKLVLG